jgi:hypothetical protein
LSRKLLAEAEISKIDTWMDGSKSANSDMSSSTRLGGDWTAPWWPPWWCGDAVLVGKAIGPELFCDWWVKIEWYLL